MNSMALLALALMAVTGVGAVVELVMELVERFFENCRK